MEPTPEPELAELHPIEPNPYAPPSVPINTPTTVSLGDADAARRFHLGRENSVKLCGAFCYIGAITITAFSWFIQLQKPQHGDVNAAEQLGGLVAGLLFAAVPIGVGNGLKGLRPWARWTVVALAPIALLYWLVVAVGGFLAGIRGLGAFGVAYAAMAAFMLVTLVLPRTRIVFTPEYRTVVAATPHIKPWAEWIIRGFSAVFLIEVAALLVLILRKI